MEPFHKRDAAGRMPVESKGPPPLRNECAGMRWTPFSGQKKTPSLDRAAALKIEESQCLKYARVTHPS
jgi:hypothetical protein